MSDATQTLENPLDTAEAQLRGIVQRHERLAAPIDQGSLGRMLVHLVNIKRSVSASTQDHVNAAKRLADFSRTIVRLTKRFPQPDEELATRMAGLAETLDTAAAELAGMSRGTGGRDNLNS